MYHRRLGHNAVLGSISLLVASCGSGERATRVPATEPGSARSAEGIVYTTLRPTNLDLYLFEPGQERPIRLTDDPALDYNPTFSPDGGWVVFTSERSGNPDLWAVRVDGVGAPVRLTDHEALDDAADFFPDGRTLVFISTRDGDADIHRMPFRPEGPLADSEAVNLTRRPGGEFNPAVSPDGRWIAYARQDKLWTDLSAENPIFDSNGADLYVMAADGSDPRELVGQAPGPEIEPGFAYGSVAGSPAWDATGEVVYYHRVTASGRAIHAVRPDGSADAAVAAEGLSPALAADGRVAFSRPDTTRGLDALDVLTTGRIVSVRPDGSDERGETVGGEFFAPAFDRTNGRLVVHGPGPVPAETRDRTLFAPPGGRTAAVLPDRTVPVWAVRGFFPALTADGDVISLHLDDGTLSRTAVDGAERSVIRVGDGVAWGASVARAADRMFVAVGPLFASGAEAVDVWTVSLSDGSARNLTGAVSGNDALPHASADGGTIVFRSGGDGGVGRVVAMGPTGEGRRRLTDFDAAETMPTISPDGQWVAFSTTRAGGWKVWIQRLDGSEGRYLEPDRGDIPDTSMHPRFSPDGRWIVVTSDRGGFNDEWPLTPFPQPYGDLWAISVADGSAVRLTHNKWEDGPNDWGPMRLPGR